MRLSIFLTLLFIISIALPYEAYRILGLFPFHGKSHFAMFGRLMEGLAERGHHVDVISHFPIEKSIPNYNDVVSLAGTIPIKVNNMTIEMIKNFQSFHHHIAYTIGNRICDLLNHIGLQNLIKNPPQDPPYDLVITEIFGANCYLAVGQHLKVPVVGLISALMHPWANDFIANPDNPAYIPHEFSNSNSRMNFWERVMNTLSNFRVKWDYYRFTSKYQNKALEEYLGPHAPSVREVERNVSLILVNSHYTLNGVRPFTTAVVEVGGLHIDESQATLPKDLEKWLDESENGFVYVSFGSMIKIESLPEKTLADLYSSFAKLAPVRVLMKIARPDELPPGLPSNVVTRTWIPQLGVLNHKNIRAFVTHGGLMGIQEAIYYGVPMIGVPIFADQGQNIRQSSQMNLAVALDYKTLTEEKLDASFRTVLNDPSYREAAKRMSVLFRDRPLSPMDTAIFWIEYVVRHGGTSLRSPAMDLAWWQIELLDVYGFLFVSIISTVFLLICILQKLNAIFHSSIKYKKL